MGGGTRPSHYGSSNSYPLRSNESNRRHGNFKHISAHTTSVSGGQSASTDIERYKASKEIKVQQEVSVTNDDDTHPLRSSR